jgi:hypothetical protein
MTIDELRSRFPEIPASLADEPVLERFAHAFADLLRVARQPSPCSREHDAANHYYLALIGPLSIHGYGLSTREQVVGELTEMLERHERDPEAFVAGLVPDDAAPAERHGPGCEGA